MSEPGSSTGHVPAARRDHAPGHHAGHAQQLSQRWREAFAEDGLDPERTAVLTRAADGVALATLFEGRLDPAEVARMRDTLLALSREPGPLVR